MAADPVATPGSASEAYEKGVSTPVNKHANSSTGGPQKQRGCCAPVTKGSIIIGFGVFLVVLGVVYGTALPAVVNSQIDAGVVTCKVKDALDEAFTDRYGDCDDCTPYYYSLSMFNVTNAMDYLEKGAKLQVKEVGPYTYRRREIRVDVELSSDSNTVSYKTYTYHTYVPEKSCESCSDKDSVISWDVGYLNVVSQAGGEVGFVTQLIKGTFWGGSLTDEQIADVIAKNGTQVMRWVNGLNSNEPKAWKNIGSSVLGFLTSTVTAVTSLDLTDFEYNGLFVRRSISQWALGYPSLLAGLALGSNYVEKCNVTGGFETQCATCKGDECNKIYAECKKCETGRKVMLINDVTCGVIKDTYAAVYGATEAETFVGSTCKTLCKAVGLCAAPLPGAAEDSGLDYSKQAPPSSALNTYIQRTGCDDKTKIGEYIQYDGFKTQPLWAKLDKRRNPTLEEINAFQVYGNCAAKTDNMTCVDVMGQDATGIKPAGTSIKGFPSKADVAELQMYLIQGKQNISVVNTGVVVDDISGIKMSRFSPPNDLLIAADWKESHGTAYPVNGVQPMAFNVGFLAWVSYPFFLYGDKSLLEGVEITMFDGNIASMDTMYENGELKQTYADRYVTTLDIEPGTGKAMRARKRLMASYGVAGSQFTKNAPMTDLVWPNLTAEIISPAYIGEESATITPDLVDTFKGVKTIISTLLPVLIVGIIVGVALAGYGFLYRRKAVLARKTAMGEAV